MYYFGKFSFNRSETFVFTKIYLPLPKWVKCNHFGHFLLKTPLVYRKNFQKWSIQLLPATSSFFFSEKGQMEPFFYQRFVHFFINFGQKKWSIYIPLGQGQKFFTSEKFMYFWKFDFSEVKHLFLPTYTFHFFCPKWLKCNHFGHVLLKTPYYIEKNFQKWNIQILITTSSFFFLLKKAKCNYFGHFLLKIP